MLLMIMTTMMMMMMMIPTAGFCKTSPLNEPLRKIAPDYMLFSQISREPPLCYLTGSVFLTFESENFKALDL